MSGPRVVVVGGGLAGLSAAVECADRGAAVTLVEARKWLGGATASFTRDGLTLDTGQHVFLRCCTAYRGFLDRLGVAGLTTLQPRMDIPVLAPGGRAGRLRRAALPAPLHLGPSLARYPFLSPGDKFRAVRASLALRRLDPSDPSLDIRTFGSWLAEHGQTDQAVRYLWDLFGLPSLNLPARKASLALAAKVFRTGLLERSDTADVGVPSVPLADLHGRPGERLLTSLGARVLLGTRVRAVRPEATGVVLGDGEIEADAVILAVPWDRVDAMLPPGPGTAVPAPGGFARLGGSPIVNVHVVYDQVVTRLPFVAALAELFPAARGARVEKFLVTRERTATFRQGPGSGSLRPGPASAVPGVFLAGAWTDTGWPATMEGAVRSGLAAAAVALGHARRTAGTLAEVAS